MNVLFLLCLLAVTEAESMLESSPLENISKIGQEKKEIRSLNCCSADLGVLPGRVQYGLGQVSANIHDSEQRLNEQIQTLHLRVSDLLSRVNELDQMARGMYKKEVETPASNDNFGSKISK